jgi:hypothetical protein
LCSKTGADGSCSPLAKALTTTETLSIRAAAPAASGAGNALIAAAAALYFVSFSARCAVNLAFSSAVILETVAG